MVKATLEQEWNGDHLMAYVLKKRDKVLDRFRFAGSDRSGVKIEHTPFDGEVSEIVISNASYEDAWRNLALTHAETRGYSVNNFTLEDKTPPF